MNINRALTLPTPKTVCVRVEANSAHRVQAATSWRMISSFAGRSAGGTGRIAAGASSRVRLAAIDEEVATGSGDCIGDAATAATIAAEAPVVAVLPEFPEFPELLRGRRALFK
jgi:hypothetical protein